jgi:DNA-binding NarL/FixJ family response regulator
MKILKIFSREKRNESKVETQLKSILDPLEPLDVPAYPQHKAGRPKILTDEKIIQVLLWKAEKLSNVEIAKRLNVNEKTIRKYLAEIN